MVLHQHMNNKDVAVEVIRFIHIKGKDYVRIKVRWRNEWKVMQ